MVSLEKKFSFCFFLHFFFHGARGRFLSLFFKEQLTLSNRDIGTLLSINPVVRVFATPFWGYIADKYCGRRFVYILSVILTTFFFCCQQLLSEIKTDEIYFYSICLRILESFFNAPFYSLLDAEILSSTKNYNYSEEESKAIWGRGRTWGSIGWGSSSFLLGLIIQLSGSTFVMIPLNIVLCLLLCVYSYNVFEPKVIRDDISILTQSETSSVEFETQSVSLDGSIGTKFEKNEIHLNLYQTISTFTSSFCTSTSGFIFLLVVFISAAGMVLVEGLSFLFFVEELKFNFVELGSLVLITVAFELPLFYYSDKLLDYFGLDKLLFIGLLGYSSRVYVYTIIPSSHKYFIIGIEWLHGITIAAVTCVRTLKVHQYTPKGLESTFQGVLWAIVAGGSFLGEFLGGRLFDLIGQRDTYRVAAIAVLVVAALHIFTSLSSRFKSKGNKYEKVVEIEKNIEMIVIK